MDEDENVDLVSNEEDDLEEKHSAQMKNLIVEICVM